MKFARAQSGPPGRCQPRRGAEVLVARKRPCSQRPGHRAHRLFYRIPGQGSAGARADALAAPAAWHYENSGRQTASSATANWWPKELFISKTAFDRFQSNLDVARANLDAAQGGLEVKLKSARRYDRQGAAGRPAAAARAEAPRARRYHPTPRLIDVVDFARAGTGGVPIPMADVARARPAGRGRAA
ncbi:hypothetical protein ACU4GD_45295, partial [Cupriavidus basilensis]